MACAAQSLSRSVPAVTAAQRPFAWPVFAIAQAKHVAVQVVSQQTPSTHARDVHSFPMVHVAPLAFRATQVPPTQKLAVTHCKSVVHPCRHPSAAHTADWQSTTAGPVQTPLLQERAAVNIVPAQIASAHLVVESYLRQAPLPSQVPSRPHIAGNSVGQLSSGSVPACTG